METKIFLLMFLCFYNLIKMHSKSTEETTDTFVITTKIPKYTSMKTSTVQTTRQTTTQTTTQTIATTTPLDCNITDPDFLEVSCTIEENDIVCQGGNVTKYPPKIYPMFPKSSNDHSVTFSAIHGLTYNASVCTTKSVGCEEECSTWLIERSVSIDDKILANVTASNNSIIINCEAWNGKMLNASYHFKIMNPRLNFSYETMVSWGAQCLVTFEDLKPGKVYNVSAFGRTFNDKNSSTILRAIVTKPEDIQLKCEKMNLSNLTIVVNDTIEGISHHYKKSYKVNYNSKTKNVNSNTITLERLKAGTPYNVSVHMELKELDPKFGETFKVISHTIECWTDLEASTSTGLIVALTIIIILLIIVIVILMCLMCRCKPSGKKTVHMSKSSVNITRFINPNFTLRKISHRLSHHPVIRMPVKASNFSMHVENMEKDSGLMYSEEFDDLKGVGRNQTAEDALLQCNRAKNRFVNILPYDATRVKLQPIEDEEGSDYINANWISGYHSKREYIATQGPLTSTMDDFWRLVWEQNCPAIVMLTLLVEKNKIKCEQYWPTESTSYGDLQVTLEGEVITEKWCLRKFKVENTATDESKTVKHFHYLEWPDMNVPEAESMLSFIHFIRENLKDEKSLETPVGPIVVHCSAGVGRSGTFIALETLLNQLEDEEDIDVYGTVMEMRKNRVQMVQTEQQYVFLYRCMKEVIEKSQPPGSSSSSYILQIQEAGTADTVITNGISGENDSSKDALIGNGKKTQESEKHKTSPSLNDQKLDETQDMQFKESGVETLPSPQGDQLS